MSDEPIQVNPSPWPEIIGVAARQIGLIGGGIVSLLGFVRGKDLAGLFAYIRGDDGVAFAGAAATVGLMFYGYYRAWRARRKLVKIAAEAPDAVAVVKP